MASVRLATLEVECFRWIDAWGTLMAKPFSDLPFADLIY